MSRISALEVTITPRGRAVLEELLALTHDDEYCGICNDVTAGYQEGRDYAKCVRHVEDALRDAVARARVKRLEERRVVVVGSEQATALARLVVAGPLTDAGVQESITNFARQILGKT